VREENDAETPGRRDAGTKTLAGKPPVARIASRVTEHKRRQFTSWLPLMILPSTAGEGEEDRAVARETTSGCGV
jgi:hypothetical protein